MNNLSTFVTLQVDDAEFSVVARPVDLNKWKIWMDDPTQTAVLKMLHALYYRPKVLPIVKASLVGGGILEIEESHTFGRDSEDGEVYLTVTTHPLKRSVSIHDLLREAITIKPVEVVGENALVIFGTIFTGILNDITVRDKIVEGAEAWLQKIGVDLDKTILVSVVPKRD